MKHEVPADHPRRDSLITREKLINGFTDRIVATAGLIAHGRGEAFDYLFGEKTNDFAVKAVRAAAARIILAKKPVVSVNGNFAALAPLDAVRLSATAHAPLEVNLFYRTARRERAIERVLKKAGAKIVLGAGRRASMVIPELSSDRRRVDPQGIGSADCVFVPLEDGDRTEALVRLGKTVITVDLNPLSRTALCATVTIIDNITRAVPLLITTIEEYKTKTAAELEAIATAFDNATNISHALAYLQTRIGGLAHDFQKKNSST